MIHVTTPGAIMTKDSSRSNTGMFVKYNTEFFCIIRKVNEYKALVSFSLKYKPYDTCLEGLQRRQSNCKHM